MSARDVVKVVLLAEAFAVTTFGLGWWSVPLVAAIWAAASRSPNRARVAALCAAGGWASLLLLDMAKGPVATMATQLGAVMSLPPVVLYLLTLLFPALLAWSAATLVPVMRRPPAEPGPPQSANQPSAVRNEPSAVRSQQSVTSGSLLPG